MLGCSCDQAKDLKFLSVFGDSNRRFDSQFKQYFLDKGFPWRDDYWVNGRFITLTFYSLVDIKQVSPTPGTFDEAVKWFPVDELPPMWLDHSEIVESAKEKLKSDVKQEHLSHKLLPRDFTMPQLHKLHQKILGENIDRSRFQKKMLASGVYERLPQIKKESPGRNPYQYRLKK